MFRHAFSFGVASLLVLAAAAPAATSTIKVPFEQLDDVPCLPDLVMISGTLLIVDGTTVDSHGGIHGHIAFQPQGVTAEGLISGNTYRAVGGTRYRFNFSGESAPNNWTFTNNYRLVAPGSNNDFHFHEIFHVTFDANGNLRVELFKTDIRCD